MTGPFLLRSVAIENFKAVLRSGPVNLTPLTALIGSNGSGKSSLIEALETYRAIVLDDLDAAMDAGGGSSMSGTSGRRMAPQERTVPGRRARMRSASE